MFNRTNASTTASTVNPSINPDLFLYAIITNVANTELLKVGEVYPVVSQLPANTEYTQAVKGDRRVTLSFGYPTVQLMGVKTGSGRSAKPYSWDAARVRVVSFSALNASQKAEALRRFGTAR